MSEQGFRIYQNVVFTKFKLEARGAILECVNRDLKGEEQDRDLLRAAILVYPHKYQKEKIFTLPILGVF